MNNKSLRRVLCVMLSAILIMLTGCTGTSDNTDETTTAPKEEFVQPTYTEAPRSVKKSETVYVNLAADGSIVSTVVTDWLHTDKPEVKVSDISSLKEIENVKSEILPVIDGTNVTWNMNTTDLYYSGKTDKAPDVNFKITYTLDGVEVKPADIVGKNGHLKINISAVNTGVKNVDVDGKQVQIYNPVVVVGGFILPENGFSATTIENGRLIGDGTKQIAVMAGLPGLQESLGLTDADLESLSIDLSSNYVIESDVTDFQLGNVLFAVIPLSTMSLDLGLSFGMEDVKNVLGLVNNIRNTFVKLNADELVDIFVNNPSRIHDIGKLLNSAVSLYTENKALIDVFTKFLTKENVEALQKLITDLQGVDLEQLVELMSNPVFKVFFQNLPTLAADIEAVMPAITELNENLQDPEVLTALENLPQTAEKLTELQGSIEKNSDIFTAITEILSNENISELSTELTMAADILNTDNLGVNLDKLIENSDALVSRVNAWLEYSEEYSIFTEAANGTQTNVMFIYETASIK